MSIDETTSIVKLYDKNQTHEVLVACLESLFIKQQTLLERVAELEATVAELKQSADYERTCAYDNPT